MKRPTPLRRGNGLIIRLGHLLGILLLVLLAADASAKDRVVYFHNDALGSPVAATGESGQPLWREDYAPYRTRLRHEDDGANRLWYTGKEEEAALGLSYYGARWYDADIGRFLERDPAGFQEGNPQSFNRYAYANNNPYRYVDPDGNSPFSALLASIVAYTGIGYALGVGADMAGQYAAFGDASLSTALTSNAAVAGGEAGFLAGVAAGYAGAKSAKQTIDVAKDVAKRPSSFRKKTVQDSWDNAAGGSKPDTKACPTCGKDVEVAPGHGRRDWDVDHQPKWKDQDLSGMDRKQVLDEYNKDVRLRCPSCNRSDN